MNKKLHTLAALLTLSLFAATQTWARENSTELEDTQILGECEAHQQYTLIPTTRLSFTPGQSYYYQIKSGKSQELSSWDDLDLKSPLCEMYSPKVSAWPPGKPILLTCKVFEGDEDWRQHSYFELFDRNSSQPSDTKVYLGFLICDLAPKDSQEATEEKPELTYQRFKKLTGQRFKIFYQD